MQKRLKAKRNKFHFGDDKAKAMVYSDFNKTRPQEQPCY